MQILEIRDVRISDIELSGINVRTDLNSEFSKENLQELANSIRENGLMQPIVLRGTYGNSPYDVVVGQRRFLAHKLLEAETIKATFTGDINEIDALALSLSENLLRQDLNHNDIMNAVTKLYVHYEKNEYTVKEKLGLSIKKIRDYIKIDEQATPKILEMFRSGTISMADAKRAITASQGNGQKADIIIDAILSMSKFDKIRTVEIGKSMPNANAEDIISKALTPKIEETIILNLPFKLSKALKEACANLAMIPEEIAMDALTEWLTKNEYLQPV